MQPENIKRFISKLDKLDSFVKYMPFTNSTDLFTFPYFSFHPFNLAKL